MDSLDKQKDVAVAAINTYLKNYLETQIDRKYKLASTRELLVPKLSDEQFNDWKNCIHKFKPKFKSFLPRPFTWEKYSCCYVHTPDQIECYDKERMKEILAEKALSCKDSSKFLLYEYTRHSPQSKCPPELHLFNDINQIDTFLKECKIRIKVTGKTANGCQEFIETAGKQSQLKFVNINVKCEFSKYSDFATTFLGGFQDTNLENIINPINKDVCALLPYLLSAYVYNFPKNQLMNRYKGIREIFEPGFSIDPSAASRKRKQLDKLSGYFQFPAKEPIWKETYSRKPGMEPEPWLAYESPVPQHSQILMWKVFVAWSGIFLTSESNFIQTEICPYIDFESSLKLFSRYIGDELPLADNLSSKDLLLRYYIIYME